MSEKEKTAGIAVEQPKPGSRVPLDPLLTRNELPDLLRLSSRTIGRLTVMRQIPQPIMVGRSYRWRRSDVVHFINGQTEVRS
jgi:predicted DNA-binding transcriptional regulator AlpA